MHRNTGRLQPPTRRNAFSLVELSIVLVILGLLVGGILAGQSLIRAAELRSVTAQYQRFYSAVFTFRDKYFALPGDMNNAQSFWGVAHATPATCATTASTTAVTCNGDGDGILEDNAAGSNEVFRFWQHLANAGLIEGTYSGVGVVTTYGATTANAPTGKLSNSLWFVYNWGTQSGATASGIFDGVYNNSFEFGGSGAATNSDPINAIFKPEELWNIDTKMDDGKPATGTLVMRGGIPSCTSAAVSSTLTATYLLTNSNLACAVMFRNQM
jgi:prepilin-type N-terminal cleavage/methylation domain-containing protein